MGAAHAHCIAKGEIEGMRLSALCDTDEGKRLRLAEEFPGVPIFSTHSELIDSGLVDAIVVATPHKDHPSVVIDGLNGGLHVLTEKPAAVRAADAEKMAHIAEKSGKSCI